MPFRTPIPILRVATPRTPPTRPLNVSAMYKGTERQVSAEVYVDGALITTWTSSGTTDGFESIDLSGSSGQLLEVTGVLADSEWLSITEVRKECQVVASNKGKKSNHRESSVA